jgi:hypothetical protein
MEISMGCLESLDKLTGIVRRGGFDVFVETGCGKGDSLAYAAKFPFKEIYSAEIVESLAVEAGKRFSDPRILVSNRDSVSFLEILLPMFPYGHILFFLDAHWPGLDFGIDCGKFAPDVALPLERELQAISRLGSGKDTIVVDDLKIYEDGPYPSGNLPRGIVPVYHESRSAQFADDLFKQTHIVERLYQDDGYLILTPKGI